MTDLPYGRGGSPLQNLIIRGNKTTKISAIKVTKGIDEGPVYLKKELNLDGTAKEIFVRSAYIIQEMIESIINSTIFPKPQKEMLLNLKGELKKKVIYNLLKI